MVSEQTKIICYKYEGKTSWFDVSRLHTEIRRNPNRGSFYDVACQWIK